MYVYIRNMYNCNCHITNMLYVYPCIYASTPLSSLSTYACISCIAAITCICASMQSTHRFAHPSTHVRAQHPKIQDWAQMVVKQKQSHKKPTHITKQHRTNTYT